MSAVVDPRAHECGIGLEQQRKLLAELLHSPALANGDISRAVQQLTEAACRLLDVARASVWRLCGAEGSMRIECVDLFDRRTGKHESGALLFAKDAPRYFAAFADERALVAHDAAEDPRTASLSATYLAPLGIGALIDAPVFVRGKMVAVVCHEHVGPARHWHFWEELVAATSSDFVAQALEAQAWLLADRALRDERDALERKVQERTHALQTMLSSTPVGLVMRRLSDQRVMFANERAVEMFEMNPASPDGLRVDDSWVDTDARQRFVEAARAGRVEGVEAQLRTRRGDTFWARLSAERIDYDGEPAYLASVDDISRVKAAEAVLREQATRDPLTAIHNRRSLLEQGSNELERTRRYQRHFSAALLDVDRFKDVNDAHGHAAGDEVLRGVVRIVSDLLRGSDLLGRWGGEELVVLLPETELRAAVAVLDRVRDAIANTTFSLANDATTRVTVSIGVAEWTGIEALESLIERADSACYDAKHQGRNRTASAIPR